MKSVLAILVFMPFVFGETSIETACKVADLKYVSVEMAKLVGNELKLNSNIDLPCTGGACLFDKTDALIGCNDKLLAEVQFDDALTGALITDAFFSVVDSKRVFDGVNVVFDSVPSADNIQNLKTGLPVDKKFVLTVSKGHINNVITNEKKDAIDHIFVKIAINEVASAKVEIDKWGKSYSIIQTDGARPDLKSSAYTGYLSQEKFGYAYVHEVAKGDVFSNTFAKCP